MGGEKCWVVLKRAVGKLKISAPTMVNGDVIVFEEGVPREVTRAQAEALVGNNNAPWQMTDHPEYEIVPDPDAPRSEGKGGEA